MNNINRFQEKYFNSLLVIILLYRSAIFFYKKNDRKACKKISEEIKIRKKLHVQENIVKYFPSKSGSRARISNSTKRYFLEEIPSRKRPNCTSYKKNVKKKEKRILEATVRSGRHATKLLVDIQSLERGGEHPHSYF